MRNKEILERLIETLNLMNEFNDKHFKENYEGLNLNEVHAIDVIGKFEGINLTLLTEKLGITKGAVAKITARLEKQEYISFYRKEGNKKEKYFKLEGSGEEVYKKHLLLHNEAINRDKTIFNKYSLDEKNIICNFLDTIKEDLSEKLEK